MAGADQSEGCATSYQPIRDDLRAYHPITDKVKGSAWAQTWCSKQFLIGIKHCVEHNSEKLAPNLIKHLEYLFHFLQEEIG